jgi:hypothetical protein
VLFRSFAGVALLAGCPGQSTPDLPAAAPAGVEVRDAAGEVTARIVAGRPCRAMVEGVELQVGAHPLVAMVGNVRWDGVESTSGTTLNRNGVRAADFVTDDAKLQVQDDQGIAVIRARVEGETAPVLDAANTTVRTAKRSGSSVTIGDMTVTGTQDLLLAALLTAHEIGPEVRALAACHRLLLSQKSAL